MPWQRHVAAVAGELNPATNLTRYRVVILKVPRQSGKTSLVEAKWTWASRRGPDRTSVYAAQSRLMARGRLLDEWEAKRLRRSVLAGNYRARRSNGTEEVRWTDWTASQSVITIVANTDDAGHGLTTDDATIDEAGLHADLTLVTALDPTMITRPDPQLWITGTVGDGTDGLLLHYEEVGELSLGDPGTDVAYFDWSATPEDDRKDPDVWRRVMPALGHTQSIDSITSRARSLTADVFDRSWLNRRPLVAATAKIPGEAWAGCAVEHVELVGPFVMALAVSLDRSAGTVAVVGQLAGGEPGRLGVVIDRRARTDWMADALADLARAYRPVAVYGDRRGGVGGIIDAATVKGAPMVELTTTDVVDSCSTFLDLVLYGQLAHHHDPVLDHAAAHAVDRPLGDAWAWSLRASIVDASPIVAATYAAAGHRRAFPVGARAPRIR